MPFAEAAAQAVELDPFDSELVADEVAIRAGAQATVMARSISQAAGSSPWRHAMAPSVRSPTGSPSPTACW